MAHRSEEFIAAWDSLAGSPDTASGWRSIPITPAAGVALRAGRRFPDNEEALLARFSSLALPVAERLPDGQGFAVERVDLQLDGKTWLALTRRASGSRDLFLTMACDIASALDSEARSDEQWLLRVFLGRVRAWQEFMRKGSPSLGPESEIGLVGELIALSSIIEAGISPSSAIEAWVGPMGGLRDFELGTGGIEIKCTLAAKGFPAKIGSLDQLDDTARQPSLLPDSDFAKFQMAATCPALSTRCADESATIPRRIDSFRRGSSRLDTSRFTQAGILGVLLIPTCA